VIYEIIEEKINENDNAVNEVESDEIEID